MEDTIETPQGDQITGDTGYDAVEKSEVDSAFGLDVGDNARFSRSSATPESAGKQSASDLEYGSVTFETPEARANEYNPDHGDIENNLVIPDLSQSLRAIEVVLRPPPDPDSYDRIPFSDTVIRVLEEYESGHEAFYTVEFKDGRIEDVSGYSTLLEYRCCGLGGFSN